MSKILLLGILSLLVPCHEETQFEHISGQNLSLAQGSTVGGLEFQTLFEVSPDAVVFN